jgi:CMP-N-acetylneuraminic acid synthetase
MTLRVLALIPARSGSKGLRHKNVRKLAGKPLLLHAIERARGATARGEAWRVVVSTDSTRYGQLASGAGAEVLMRPAALASDSAPLTRVVAHALEHYAPDVVVMLTATTPLVTSADVRRGMRTFKQDPAQSVAAVVRDATAASWRFHSGADGRLLGPARRVTRRQVEAAVILCGAFYIASPAWLLRYGQFVVAGRSVGCEVPRWRAVDIEVLADLHAVEQLLAAARPRPR